VKRSDIPDELVIDLARAWRDGDMFAPGVVSALIQRGIPPKLAVAKVEHLIARGILECGVSANYAWPR